MVESAFRSAEGMRQEDPLVAAGFCIAIRLEVQELDGALVCTGAVRNLTWMTSMLWALRQLYPLQSWNLPDP